MVLTVVVLKAPVWNGEHRNQENVQENYEDVHVPNEGMTPSLITGLYSFAKLSLHLESIIEQDLVLNFIDVSILLYDGISNGKRLIKGCLPEVFLFTSATFQKTAAIS